MKRPFLFSSLVRFVAAASVAARPTLPVVLLAFALFPAQGRAEDPLIAIGHVNGGNGVLFNGFSNVGGVVACVRTEEGRYVVTVTSPGAFAGKTNNEAYLTIASPTAPFQRDTEVNGRVSAVSSNILQANFETHDMEQATGSSPNFPLDDDVSFVFVIYRGMGGFDTAALSRGLVATGTVNGDGTLRTAVGVGGLEISSVRTQTGEYEIELARPGTAPFLGSSSSDYICLTSIDGFNVFFPDDEVSRGVFSAFFSDGTLMRVRVNVDDVQDDADEDEPVPFDRAFHFAVYRIFPNLPAPRSKLIRAYGTGRFPARVC